MTSRKLEVQEYLRKNGLNALCDSYQVMARRSILHPNLVLLKYDQINSPMGEKIVQQCRGIIFDETDNWKVISRPYDKFFNHEEGHAAKIDWSTAKVFEKLDGSLMTVYWYDGLWRVSTSGTPDGAPEVNGTGKSFATLFWEVWKELGYHLPINPDLCYMFELMTPWNRVVVRHEKNRIVHHGARFLSDGMDEMYPFNGGECFGWEVAKTFDLSNLDGVLAAAKELNPIEAEGYIVVDHMFRRVKVKSPAYVALHHVISNMSKRKLLEFMKVGEASEVIAYYPEWAPVLKELDEKIAALVKEAEDYYDTIDEISDQKDFAHWALKFKHPAALFTKRKNPSKTFQEYFLGLNIKTLEELLGVANP
jgi:hypothetical protein